MLTAYKGKRNEHRIVIRSLDGSAVEYADFGEVRFAIADGPGADELIDKLKTNATDFTELTNANSDEITLRVDLPIADTTSLTVQTYQYQVSVTPTAGEEMVTEVGVWNLKDST